MGKISKLCISTNLKIINAMKKLIFMMCLAAGAVTLNSCDDDDSIAGNGDYTYKVRMTDAPGPYDQVNIDIQSIAIVDGDGNTVTLDDDLGVYNLLELSNGNSIQLAARNLDDNQVSQIKLTLGANSTIVVDGTSYPLSFTSSDGAGLTLNVNQTLDSDDDNEILLDFDANNSIVATGANSYKVVPVIRAVDADLEGSISGDVNGTSLAIVTATNLSSDIFSTSINSSGNFKVQGLPPGSYTLTVTPLLPLLPVTQSNINVVANQNTSVSVIDFNDN
jgi:hypothetical protein